MRTAPRVDVDLVRVYITDVAIKIRQRSSRSGGSGGKATRGHSRHIGTAATAAAPFLVIITRGALQRL